MSKPVTPADVEAMRARLREMALEIAQTEDQVAVVFDQLAETRGDADGHRKRIADEARRYASLERSRAAENPAH